jgi:HK97 family phage major capsid protein
VFVALDTADVADPIIDAFYAVAQQYRGNGIWIMRSTVEAKIRKVKDTQEQYIWQPGLSAGAPGTILGRPVFSSEFMPADAQNNVVLLFGDLRGYWIFDRLDMEIQRLDERYAEQSQIGYVLTRRLGGQVTQAYMFRTLTRTGA